MMNGEKDIIKRAIRGEASAFGLLYDRYQPQIYRFIYLKVSHREEAEDLTHQVFLSSWENIGEYRHRGFPFGSWLYRIARNRIIDFYRAKKIIVDIEDADFENSALPEDGNSVVEIAEQNLDIEKVKSAIAELKPLEQDVLILRFIEDAPPAEVAKILDKKPEAIRLLQHRAIQKIKKILNSKP